MLQDIISNCISAAIVGLFGVAILRKGEEEGRKSPIRYKDILILLLVFLFLGAVIGWVISVDPSGSLWQRQIARVEPHINLLMKIVLSSAIYGGILPVGLFIAYMTLNLASVPEDICDKTFSICKESAFWVLAGILVGLFCLEIECIAVGDFAPAANLLPHSIRGMIYASAVYLQASMAPACIAVYSGLIVDESRFIRNEFLKRKGKHYKKF